MGYGLTVTEGHVEGIGVKYVDTKEHFPVEIQRNFE
jgi:hypothetical protein